MIETKQICKDCKSQTRPAPYPGPRCFTCFHKRKRETKGASHDKYVQRTYNMEPGEYERRYKEQGGVCAMCKRATGKTRKLSVDHDHSCCPETPTCGKCTRRLICRPCNDLLGHGRDNPEFFARTAEYLIITKMELEEKKRTE